MTNPPVTGSRAARPSKSLEQYEKRMHIYRTAKSFIAQIVTEANPQFGELIAFIRDVDEATFLFDETAYQYLNELYQKAVRLRYIQHEMQRQKTGKPTFDFPLEESQLHVWFTEQFTELKKTLSPFLRWE